MLKHEEESSPDSCWNNAEPDEPVFVLKASDILFEQAVMYWAFLAQANGAPAAKVDEAVACAKQGGAYLRKKIPD